MSPSRTRCLSRRGEVRNRGREGQGVGGVGGLQCQELRPVKYKMTYDDALVWLTDIDVDRCSRGL
eukprot:3610435-Pyramimonas_sp.AAC.1